VAWVQGVTTGVVVFMIVSAVVGLAVWDGGRTERAGGRVVEAKPAGDPQEQLARLIEVSLEKAPDPRVNPNVAKEQQRRLIDNVCMENRKKRDGFLLAQLDVRNDLRGLPFRMGDDCRLDKKHSLAFNTEVLAVRRAVDRDRAQEPKRADGKHDTFWNTYRFMDAGNSAGIAALTQILGPESDSMRGSLVHHLAQSNEPAATRELAKAALFDSVGKTRMAAIKALKIRPKEEYGDILLHGLRYPMPQVSKRAAQALIMLERKDLLPAVAEFLGEAAPGDPFETTQNGEKAMAVREVVKINHHRNCLLCHAPAETGVPAEVPALMPTPGFPFPRSSQEYYGGPDLRTEPAVRADTTYLRQDFSVMMPVADAAPWPDLQRFDFVVRTRVIEGDELVKLQARLKDRPAGFQSEQHKAALRVLRELTGRDAPADAAAWKRVLGG
jgi:hypothetical protein